MIVNCPGWSAGGANAPGALCVGDDAPALRRLVAERSQQRGFRKLLRGDASQRINRRGLPVAERDRAGLVEQQHVAVSSRFDGAAGRGDDVGAHHPPHAGHADRREQPADRRRDQTHQKRDQHRDRYRRAGLRDLDAVERIRQQRDGCQQKDERHRDEQNGQRDLVRRLLALCALDHADHTVEKGFARIDVDPYDDPVGQHTGSSGHGVEVAARGADHRGAFPGDRRLVDRRHALDDFPVTRHEVALHDQDDVAFAQAGRRYGSLRRSACGLRELPGGRVFARALRRGGLRLAAPLGYRFGEVRKQQRSTHSPSVTARMKPAGASPLPPSAWTHRIVVRMLPI